MRTFARILGVLLLGLMPAAAAVNQVPPGGAGGSATNAQPPSANLTNWSTVSTGAYIRSSSGIGTNTTLLGNVNMGTNNIMASTAAPSVVIGNNNWVTNVKSLVGGNYNSTYGSLENEEGSGFIFAHRSIAGFHDTLQEDGFGIFGGHHQTNYGNSGAVIVGGLENLIGNRTSADLGVHGGAAVGIFAGRFNSISNAVTYGTISGGSNNIIRGADDGGVTFAQGGHIGGGRHNVISNSYFSVIAGGASNQILGAHYAGVFGSRLTNTTTGTWDWGNHDWSKATISDTALTVRSNLVCNGNVGIFTNSPQRKLHVNGDALIESSMTVIGPQTNQQPIYVQRAGASPSRIDIYETNKTFSSAIQGPLNLTNNVTIIFPTNHPTAGVSNLAVVRTTSGTTGVTNEWDYIAVSGGSGTPGGTNGQIQFNLGGAFAGTTNMNWYPLKGLSLGYNLQRQPTDHDGFTGILEIGITNGGGTPAIFIGDGLGNTNMITVGAIGSVNPLHGLSLRAGGAERWAIGAAASGAHAFRPTTTLAYDLGQTANYVRTSYVAAVVVKTNIVWTPQTNALSGAGTSNIVVDLANNSYLVRATPTANFGLLFTNVIDGLEGRIEVKQDGTGIRTGSTPYGAGPSGSGGGAFTNTYFGTDITFPLTFSTNANYIDEIKWVSRGTNVIIVGFLRGYPAP